MTETTIALAVVPPNKAAIARKRHPLMMGCFFIIGFIVVVGVISSMIATPNQATNPAPTSPTPDGSNAATTAPVTEDAPAPTQEDLCRSDWSKCADNEQLVNNYSDWSKVQVECKMEAEHEAEYGSPSWPWLAFGNFLKGKDYVSTGVATAIEPDAQFQNGFGAMVHSTVTCEYDLRTQKVTNISIVPH